MICKNCGAELPDASDFCFSCGEAQTSENFVGFKPIAQKSQIREQIILICTMIMTVLFLISGIYKFSFCYGKLSTLFMERAVYASVSMDSAVEQLYGMGISDFAERNDGWSEAVTYIDVGLSLVSLVLLLIALVHMIKRSFDKAAEAVGISALVLPVAHAANFLLFIHYRSKTEIPVFSAVPFIMIVLDILTAVICFRVSKKAYHISIGDKYDTGSIAGYMPFFTILSGLFMAFGVICFSLASNEVSIHGFNSYSVSVDIFTDYSYVYAIGIKDYFSVIDDNTYRAVIIIDFAVFCLSVVSLAVSAVMVSRKRTAGSLKLAAISLIMPVIGYISNMVLRFHLTKGKDHMSVIMRSHNLKFSPVPIVMIVVCALVCAAALYSARSVSSDDTITYEL